MCRPEFRETSACQVIAIIFVIALPSSEFIYALLQMSSTSLCLLCRYFIIRSNTDTQVDLVSLIPPTRPLPPSPNRNRSGRKPAGSATPAWQTADATASLAFAHCPNSASLPLVVVDTAPCWSCVSSIPALANAMQGASRVALNQNSHQACDQRQGVERSAVSGSCSYSSTPIHRECRLLRDREVLCSRDPCGAFGFRRSGLADRCFLGGLWHVVSSWTEPKRTWYNSARCIYTAFRQYLFGHNDQPKWHEVDELELTTVNVDFQTAWSAEALPTMVTGISWPRQC